MKVLPGDSVELRMARGAFFTPPAIAEHLAEWAIRGKQDASVLDTTCGEAVLLLAVGKELRPLERKDADVADQLLGVDLHEESLAEAANLPES